MPPVSDFGFPRPNGPITCEQASSGSQSGILDSGATASVIGFSDGTLDAALGVSCSPIYATTVHIMVSNISPPLPTPGFGIILQGLLAQDFFTSITIEGQTYLTAVATVYQQSIVGNYTEWAWHTISPLAVAGIYNFTYV